jgi:septum formation inhibitor MinC
VQDLEEQLAAAPTNLADPSSVLNHDQAGEAQNDIQELEQRLKDAKRIAGAWDTLKKIEQHYNSTGNQFDDEQSQQL